MRVHSWVRRTLAMAPFVSSRAAVQKEENESLSDLNLHRTRCDDGISIRILLLSVFSSSGAGLSSEMPFTMGGSVQGMRLHARHRG